MRVAVITPLFKARPEWALECLASVRAQTHACTHIVVADGLPRPPLPGFNGQFIGLDKNHADYGDTPRAIGSISAMAQGFDAIAYLDDDNWFHPQHIESLVALQQRTGADLCSSARLIHALDGSLLGRCPQNGVSFVDTSCYFLARGAFALCTQWACIPQRFHPIGDRYLWMAAHHLGLRYAHSGLHSSHYRSSLLASYRSAGRTPPPEGREPPWQDSLLDDLQQHFQSGRWRQPG